jgi:hypothetical protein
MSRGSYRKSVDEKMVRERPDPEAPRSVQVGPRWDYKNVLLPRLADISIYGAEGWELVCTTPQPADQIVFHFRRRKA